jgi:S1-C subfamily serine protease
MRVPSSLAATVVLLACASTARAADELAALRRAFADQAGAELVFARDELPAGRWYDRMPALDRAQQVAAARILVDEARRYPAGWLGSLGLRRVGVFAALVSERGDGFRPYDDDRGGYLYYGLWNGADAVAASYYTDGQLPLTFHHEVFHHVDGHAGGDAFTADDARFTAAIAGARRYPALAVSAADLAALAARAGDPLAGAVGDYAGKSAGEDQAETARWVQSHLATALWQAAARPELAGSQRVLHVLAEYEASGAGAPDAAWWVDVALGRDPVRMRAARDFSLQVDRGYRDLTARIAPRGEPAFVVWGREQRGGGNPTLRADVARFGEVAARLGAVASSAGASARARADAAARLSGLLDRYQAYIASNWAVSPGTLAVFAAARATIATSLPAPAPAPAVVDNPYLAKVDDEIADPAWRAAIRAAQPATVKLGGGSGVNLSSSGLILTAAHVVDEVGRELVVRFPDGRSFRGVATVVDGELDLGLVALRGAAGLPVARLASAAPVTGDDVAIVGQPGTRTPDGEATGYQPWHVSTGEIRGYRKGARTGEQHLGRLKHDAWTYWGHSGSPLFDRAGAIVGLHNSWDSSTAMRHAVTWEAITAFLRAAGTTR